MASRIMSWSGRRTQRLAAAVVAVYGWTCWLCHQPINPTARRTTSAGLSVDHVVPRSLGGTDHIANLRPAHMGCNAARGTNPPMTDAPGPTPQRRTAQRGRLFPAPDDTGKGHCPFLPRPHQKIPKRD